MNFAYEINGKIDSNDSTQFQNESSNKNCLLIELLFSCENSCAYLNVNKWIVQFTKRSLIQYQSKFLSNFPIVYSIDEFFFFYLFYLYCFHRIFHCRRIGQANTSHSSLLHPFKYRQRKSISLYQRTFSDQSNRSKFQLKKALIVTKLSRYEFEQHKNPKLTVAQLEQMLRDRGTDYDLLLHYHHIHKNFESKVADSFKEFGIDVKLVNR